MCECVWVGGGARFILGKKAEEPPLFFPPSLRLLRPPLRFRQRGGARFILGWHARIKALPLGQERELLLEINRDQ